MEYVNKEDIQLIVEYQWTKELSEDQIEALLNSNTMPGVLVVIYKALKQQTKLLIDAGAATFKITKNILDEYFFCAEFYEKSLYMIKLTTTHDEYKFEACKRIEKDKEDSIRTLIEVYDKLVHKCLAKIEGEIV